ncbi:Acyl carrier protein 1 [Morus notabilis]|uniref:Acyl carrier protein n=1 Tax=Morus notabilis TaxID=981085 RepID=W9REU6_9ROSA|nr:acyl carrier protein 1, chloroplastic [Morus notabilis]EXB67659.1 Acyl carrier protein 1 [Morus notabilis]
MASVTGASISLRSRPSQLHRSLATSSIYGSRSVSLNAYGRSSLSFSSRPRFGRLQVTCAAKVEIVNKVIGIVKKQLALADDAEVSGKSTFSGLGADSLDTVEIVMGLEEEFGICVEEESAQSISTVEEAAELIEKLSAKKQDS